MGATSVSSCAELGDDPVGESAVDDPLALASSTSRVNCQARRAVLGTCVFIEGTLSSLRSGTSVEGEPYHLEPLAILPVHAIARRGSVLQLYPDGARANRGLQRGMVPLGLIRIGERERTHRLVEVVRLAEIAADLPGSAGLGMRTRADPAADLGVDREHPGV